MSAVPVGNLNMELAKVHYSILDELTSYCARTEIDR